MRRWSLAAASGLLTLTTHAACRGEAPRPAAEPPRPAVAAPLAAAEVPAAPAGAGRVLTEDVRLGIVWTANVMGELEPCG